MLIFGKILKWSLIEARNFLNFQVYVSYIWSLTIELLTYWVVKGLLDLSFKVNVHKSIAIPMLIKYVSFEHKK